MVVDAETLKSISGAEVSIEPVSLLLPEFLKLLLPNGDTGHTNSEGLVTLRVAKHDAGFLMAVNASDYEMTGDYPRKSSWLDAMSKVLPGQIAHIEWNHE